MADVLQDFPIAAPPDRVFAAISTPAGRDEWWALGSSGTPVERSVYALDFGPEYQRQARVVRCVPDKEFELELTSAMRDRPLCGSSERVSRQHFTPASTRS